MGLNNASSFSQGIGFSGRQGWMSDAQSSHEGLIAGGRGLQRPCQGWRWIFYFSDVVHVDIPGR